MAEPPHDITITVIFSRGLSVDDPEHPRFADIVEFRKQVKEAIGLPADHAGQLRFTIAAADFPEGRTGTQAYPSTVAEIRQHCHRKIIAKFCDAAKRDVSTRIVGATVVPSREMVVKMPHYDRKTAVLGPEQNEFVLEVSCISLWLYDWAFMRNPERKRLATEYTMVPHPLSNMAHLCEFLKKQFGTGSYGDNSHVLAPTCLSFDSDDKECVDRFTPQPAPSVGGFYASCMDMPRNVPTIPAMNVCVVFGRTIGEHSKGTVVRKNMGMFAADKLLKQCTAVVSDAKSKDFAFVAPENDDFVTALLNAPTGVADHPKYGGAANPKLSVIITL